MKILSVDDDELILELLVESLAMHGFDDVVPVESAQGALDLIKALDGDSPDQETGVFDCFLLDIQMPGMDGIELCARIRAMPAYKYTPILMVTTLSDRKHIEKAFAAGATDYITKPFDQIEVGARIRLANMLVKEQRRGLQTYFLATSIASSSGDDRSALFQAPVTVEGVDKVVDVLVLENFLLQLSKKGLHQSAAIAFKFYAAQEAFNSHSEEEYYNLLELVAKIISESFGETNFLLSHFGCGIFVAVIDRGSPPIAQDIGKKINDAAEKAGIKPGENWPAIVVGDMVEVPIERKDDFHAMLLDATASVAEKSYRLGKTAGEVNKIATKGLKFKVF
jgi:CheY-like chemotaxis protein